MACKFCFSTESLKPNEIAVFHSDNGEEYRVKYAFEFRSVSVTVEWTLPKNVLITVDLNTADVKHIASKSKTAKGKTVCLTFCDVLKSDNKVECRFIFVISLIPFAEVKDCQINFNGNSCESIKCSEMSDPLENTLMGLTNGSKRNTCESNKFNEMGDPLENTLMGLANGSNRNACESNKFNEMSDPLENTLKGLAVGDGSNGNAYESNKCDEMSDPLENSLIGLVVDMRNLLISGYNSDVVLTNGNKECRVHSTILSARSQVFKEILSHPLEEKKIVVSGACDGVLDDMITFIYCGYVKIADIKRAEELYKLACKFQIEDLRGVCSKYLSKLTVDRAVDTLILADKYDDSYLKSASVNFIAKNLHKLKADEKWMLFAKENFNLVTETLSLISDVLEKNNLYAFLLRISDESKDV